MDNVLQGKSALVVGGTSGIGYCLVQSLLQESVSVVVQGRMNSKRVTNLCCQGNVACFICDLQNDSYVEELCKYANAADILCVVYGPFLQKPLDMTTVQEWNTTVYANLTLPGILVSSALTGMKERKWGRILLFGGTETQVLRGFRTNAVYGAAKTGIMSLVKSVSMEYARYGITANAVCPGFTDSGLLSEETRAMWEKKNPDGKLVDPSAITDAALFLLKDSAYNGVVMPVDKGWSSF
ncbi:MULTISPECIES: SDR family NAD(P)-dependent oxidoreductase [unclassified Treponema]|uniref:SDR family NAD(P)-dependent oxidoreductase n=1 Tax=unclassified Treponema TaxID=2638727 RepID=UPI000530111D|nr:MULTISPECIES: SDR family oxidoreductase [unclassified Treponema]AIW89362.1 3-hydroxybutyrate dehydrogenase [Treponema sp. OMZ 838]UTC42753.1 SDR family oxidoreductase [Treponema sp. OMZ 857]UTC50601.1 SDR family oxidoreductase [Treponema sp. OMZ 855]